MCRDKHVCCGCGKCRSKENTMPVSSEETGKGVPIGLIRSGESVTVAYISGKDGVRRILQDLGLTEGTEVILLSNDSRDMILDVKGSRIAVDRTLAGRIHVTPGK